jgi:general secretion pathway protein K
MTDLRDGRRMGRQRGFALLIVLWTVGFLALLGTQILASGRSDIRVADNLKQEAVLQAAADGAVQHVMFSIVAARDARIRPDGLMREIRIGQTPVLVRVENESDRINLNRATPALLRALIIDVGAAPAVAERLATAITDWHNLGTDTAPGAVQAPQYRAAGLSHGPPGDPFQSVDELVDVLGMTPVLFKRLAPHVTVLSADDPDTNTRDPVVANALTDTQRAADVADDLEQAIGRNQLQQPDDEEDLRIVATAVGTGNARYTSVVVASADFQSPTPNVNILLRERVSRDTDTAAIVSGF